jgi:hypothetical protein
VFPHRHAPLRHWLLLVELQAKQLAPLAPHWVNDVAVTQLSLVSQQPGQFELLSQTQVPEPVVVQRWPATQAAFILQRQTPLVQRSPTVVQSEQATPPMPQLSVSETLQTPLRQQPLGQLVALQVLPQLPPSHLHAPLTQVAGEAQAAELPHAHWPVAEQLSARVAVQAVHVPPSVPQVATEAVRHSPAWQQPRGHEAELHTQLPLTHCCPGAHWPPSPQRHEPLAQLLASSVLQAVHAPPAEPHAPRLGVLQVEPVQQPPSQLSAQSGHTPASQLPCKHAEHAAPAVPHWALVLPGKQLLPSQQPLGQVAALHVQPPLTQVWPGMHSAFEPQRQTPLSQRSEATGSHAEQLPPPVPQRLRLPSTHSPFSQQPLGQLAASQSRAEVTLTTTVVSAPERARPSACPLPTSEPEPRAMTFTVTVPVYDSGSARRTDCSSPSGSVEAGSGRSMGPRLAAPALSTENDSWSTAGSEASRLTCTKMVGALLHDATTKPIHATAMTARRFMCGFPSELNAAEAGLG